MTRNELLQQLIRMQDAPDCNVRVCIGTEEYDLTSVVIEHDSQEGAVCIIDAQ